MIISTKTWPSSWKLANIIPVCKPNKPSKELSSYRPIALLCAVSKIAEKVLYTQMEKFIEQNNILPPNQHGFRKARGTESALATTATAAVTALAKGKAISLATYDFSAAFDTISVTIFKTKISSWASQSTTDLLVSYLTGGRQRVYWNNSLSTERDVKYGVRQGSILGLLLFILTTHPVL